MQHERTWLPEEEDEDAADRQTASLAGVVVTLVLMIVGLFLIHQLEAKAAIEDCLMSGRSNCTPLIVTRSDPD
jgi:hypothetical protein